MIDLIYNNLMNVNNVAIQGEGRGYPRPIQNGNSIIYSSTCVYALIGQFQTRSELFFYFFVVKSLQLFNLYFYTAD